LPEPLIFRVQEYYMRPLLIFLTGILLWTSCTINEQEKGKKTDKLALEPEFRSGLTEDTACLLSQVAYCINIDSTLRQYMPGWGLIWEGKELNGNHAFVAGNGREYALAIRGSLINFSWAAFQNWVYQDLHVTTQEKWPFAADSLNARVSAGSYTGWQNLETMTDLKTGRLLLPVLDSILETGTPLLITGHSLGGNLATVYGSFLASAREKKGKKSDEINIITFAAPAAGNEGFASDFNNKFPQSVRVENRFDIVPKFPAADRIATLGELYNDSLSAARILVGYKNLQIPLTRVFGLIKSSFTVLEFTSGLSPYVQTSGDGKQISIPLSMKNTGKDIMDWLGEAAIQHSVASYAMYEKVPVISSK
jgi:triacylglycerol lipase